MDTALWIVAGLLAVIYLVSGVGKLFIPREKIAGVGSAAGWVLDFSPGTLKAIGAIELVGAVGLILPALLDLAPVLVPLAALGLALVMAGAVVLRIRRHEPKVALLDLGYLALCAFVAIGRA
ncbi:DoxX family protein [Amycolatopsis pittospori]|uniref:DoxX family protein n=1 Tax=Amycolatopsis pittospori TaxID=2749434 RepID=UPI0015F0FCD5|nr:DoxX family protein [Amycolatopsis pittospori]